MINLSYDRAVLKRKLTPYLVCALGLCPVSASLSYARTPLVPESADDLSNCEGALLPKLTLKIHPDFQHLKPYYESHLNKVVELLPGWVLPREVTFIFNTPDTDGVADTATGVVELPALYGEPGTGLLASEEQTLSIAIHEFGHIAIHGEAARLSKNWKHLQSRRDLIMREYGSATPERQAEFKVEINRIRNILQFAFLGYQEIFSDFLAVVYLHDPRAIYNSKYVNPNAKRDDAEYYFRNFDANYGAVDRARAENYLRALVAEKQPVQHLVFGLARAGIWNVVKDRLQTPAQKQAALNALLTAICRQFEHLSPEYFNREGEIDWLAMNDGLVAEFTQRLNALTQK